MYAVVSNQFDEITVEWGNWGEWSDCKSTAGLGVRDRQRECFVEGALASPEECEGEPVQAEGCFSEATFDESKYRLGI